MLPVKQHLDPAVQCGEQVTDGNAFDLYTIQYAAVRHHFHETEAAPKGSIQQSDGTVCRIHGAQ